MSAADGLLGVNRAKEAILGDADGNFQPRPFRQLPRPPGQRRFSRSLIAADQKAACMRIDQRQEEGALGFFHPADRRQRVSLPLHSSMTLSTSSQLRDCSSKGRRLMR